MSHTGIDKSIDEGDNGMPLGLPGKMERERTGGTTLIRDVEENPNVTAKPMGKRKLNAMSTRIPTDGQERHHTHAKHGEHSCPSKVLAFIHSNAVQTFLMALLIADVIVLFIELYLSAEYPSCSIITRDALSCCPATGTDDHTDDGHHLLRFLSGDSDICESGQVYDYTAGCDDHKYSEVHTAHSVLRGVTIVILSTFVLELLTLVFILGPASFFSQFFYVLDLTIVTLSLALELAFVYINATGLEAAAGMIILARLWRFVRIGHGIFETTHEMASKEKEELENYTKKLEEIMKENGLEIPEFDEARGD